MIGILTALAVLVTFEDTSSGELHHSQNNPNECLVVMNSPLRWNGSLYMESLNHASTGSVLLFLVEVFLT